MEGRAALLFHAFRCGACSDSPTDSGESPVPLGEAVVATTAADGQATVTFQGAGDDEYHIPVTLRDFDTERGVPSLEVHAVALADGIFLRTEDPGGRYFSSMQYIPYSQS